MGRRAALINAGKVYAASALPGHHRAGFVVVTRGRTGSTLLMSLLDSNPAVIGARELLARRRLLPVRYVTGYLAMAGRARPETTVAGFKVLAYQLRRIQRGRHLPRLVPGLHASGWKVVHLVRRDALRVALSNAAARQTQFHHHGMVEHEPFAVDLGMVEQFLDGAATAEATEQEILGGVPHLVVTYEDDLERAECHQATADRVFAYIGVPTAPVQTTHVKSLPARIEDTVTNYDELCAALRGTPYERYLDSPGPR